MAREQHRHDISDKAWEKIRPYTIGEKGTRGGNARDTRQFINGVFWILRTGAPWRDLPETFGNWKNVHRRFCRWRDKGIWEKILEPCVDNRDAARKQGNKITHFKQKRKIEVEKEIKKFAFSKRPLVSKKLRTEDARSAFCRRSKLAIPIRF